MTDMRLAEAGWSGGMTMTLERANDRAQRRFRDMLRAYYREGTWETPEKALYLESQALFVWLQDQLACEDQKAEVAQYAIAERETEAELRLIWGDR